MTLLTADPEPNLPYAERSPLGKVWLDAANVRYGNANSAWIFQPSADHNPDLFALATPRRERILAIGTWPELLPAYLSRPPYVPPQSSARHTRSEATKFLADLLGV